MKTVLYTDIYDCKVDPYHLCIEKKDLKYLIKKGKYSEELDEQLENTFQLIRDQLIDEFGVSEKFEIYFYKQRDINKLEIKVLEGDRAAITFLNAYKSDLELIEKNISKDYDCKKEHARLHRIIQTKYIGRDTHKLTVFEFYNDIHDIIDEQKDKVAIESDPERKVM